VPGVWAPRAPAALALAAEDPVTPDDRPPAAGAPVPVAPEPGPPDWGAAPPDEAPTEPGPPPPPIDSLTLPPPIGAVFTAALLASPR
jgi:hypothetical protein